MNPTVEIYGKPNCLKCMAAGAKVELYVERRGLTGQVKVIKYNLETIDGRAMACFRDVDWGGNTPVVLFLGQDIEKERVVGSIDSTQIEDGLNKILEETHSAEVNI